MKVRFEASGLKPQVASPCLPLGRGAIEIGRDAVGSVSAPLRGISTKGERGYGSRSLASVDQVVARRTEAETAGGHRIGECLDRLAGLAAVRSCSATCCTLPNR